MPRPSEIGTTHHQEQCPHCKKFFVQLDLHLYRGDGCTVQQESAATPAQGAVPTWIHLARNNTSRGAMAPPPPPDDRSDEDMIPPPVDEDGDESTSPAHPEPQEMSTRQEPSATLMFRTRSARTRHQEQQPSGPDPHSDWLESVSEYNGAGVTQYLPLMGAGSFDEDNDPDVTMVQPVAVLNEAEEICRANPKNPTLEYWDDKICVPANDRIHDHYFTRPDRFMIRLMDVLGRANCPLWVTDSIVKVFQEETLNGLDLKTDAVVTRETLLKKLSKRFPVPQPLLSHISLEISPPKGSGRVDYEKWAPRTRRDTAKLVYYQFLDQVKDLNADLSIFGDLNNLCVDPSDPFGGNPGCTDGLVDELVDAEWYQKTRRDIEDNLVKDGEPFLVLPVVMYVDKTGVDTFQRYGVEPLMFTIGIIRRKLRNKAEAWRLLGLLPDLNLKSSASQKRDRDSEFGKSRHARNYHRCLAKVLESFVNNQGFKEPLYGQFRLGPYIQKVRLFFPLCCFLGDALSGDRLCGRYEAYQNVNRLTRSCDVSSANADNLYHQCRLLKMNDFQEDAVYALKLMGILECESDDDEIPSDDEQRKQDLKVVEEEFQNNSQHIVDSAFAPVWFGVNKRGILGASPVDLMHAFLHGVLVYLLRVFFSSFTDTHRQKLDNLVDRMLNQVHSSERKNFPRIGFSKGVTNLTLLTHDEWAGMAFTVALVAISEDGRKLLDSVYERPTSQKVDSPPEIRCHPLDILEILELVLAFHAWYKCGHPFPVSSRAEKDAVLQQIRDMLQLIMTKLPRHEGEGWKLQKLHDLLHLALDMLLFGSPLNWDTGPCKNNLIAFAKKSSKNSRKCHSTFLKSLAERLRESATVRRAINALNRSEGRDTVPLVDCDDSDDSDDDSQDDRSSSVLLSELVGNPKYEVYFEPKRRQLQTGVPKRRHKDRFERQVWYKWLSKNKVAGHRQLHPALIDYLREEIEHSDDAFSRIRKLECFTEYKRNGVLFRAHPNYQSNGEWYDWVMIKCDYDNSSFGRKQRKNARGLGFHGDDFYPTKLLCFYRHPENGSIRAIGHCCTANNHKEDSKLFERWELQYDQNGYPVLWDFPTDSFGERVLVVEDHPGLFEFNPKSRKREKVWVTLVTPRERFWPGEFLDKEGGYV